MLTKKSRRGSRRGAGSENVESSGAASSEMTGDFNSDLENFAKDVLKAMSQDNMPPFSSYYQLYFDKLLDDKPYEFRKQVSELLESESNSEDEKQMRLEQQLQQGFTFSKEMLQNVATLYKATSTMIEISKKRLKESEAINNPSAVKNLTYSIQRDMEKLMGILNKQSTSIKTLYNKSAKIIQEVQGETIYDAVYGIFNKRYIMDQIKYETTQMQKFNHESSFIVTKLARSVEKETNDKQLAMINRTISKLLLKTSRRSDVVGHLGDGFFAMLLKHTDTQNAIRASGRLADMVGASHFFLGEKEVKLEIKIGIAALDANQEVESIIASALDAQDNADKAEGTIYAVAEQQSGMGSEELA